MSKICVLAYFITTLCKIETARILGVFPSPSISHQVVFRVLTQELARRGHEVTVITADPAFPKGQAPTNLTEIDVHDISYNYLRDVLPELMFEYEYGQEIPIENQLRVVFGVLEVQVQYKPVKKLIQEKREFDVVLIEAFMRPAIAFSHFFKAPVILVSSFGATPENLAAFGAPSHPLLYPIAYRQRLYNLTVWEKLREYYYYTLDIYKQKSNERFDDELSRKLFGPNIPPVSELNQNVDLLLLNVHPIWMHNQPVPPGMIFMGGIHQKPTKELPQDFKSYLDSSINGVVYVSFGTNVHPKLFPAERLKVITEALSELPYDILFKWSDDELPGRTGNIKHSKWLPQSDLLRHPKIKAFVMQGGLQSTDEAITAGVPLVCIPMLGDQWYNAEKYVQLKIGVKLNFLTLTKSELKNAIQTVILDNSYRENIVKLRDRIYDQPQSPLERAVWWVEYVLRHGGAKHLRAPAANMSWAEYYELELILIVLICLVLILLLVLTIGIFLWQYIISFVNTNTYSAKVKKS